MLQREMKYLLKLDYICSGKTRETETAGNIQSREAGVDIVRGEGRLADTPHFVIVSLIPHFVIVIKHQFLADRP